MKHIQKTFTAIACCCYISWVIVVIQVIQVADAWGTFKVRIPSFPRTSIGTGMASNGNGNGSTNGSANANSSANANANSSANSSADANGSANLNINAKAKASTIAGKNGKRNARKNPFATKQPISSTTSTNVEANTNASTNASTNANTGIDINSKKRFRRAKNIILVPIMIAKRRRQKIQQRKLQLTDNNDNNNNSNQIKRRRQTVVIPLSNQQIYTSVKPPSSLPPISKSKSNARSNAKQPHNTNTNTNTNKESASLNFQKLNKKVDSFKYIDPILKEEKKKEDEKENVSGVLKITVDASADTATDADTDADASSTITTSPPPSTSTPPQQQERTKDITTPANNAATTAATATTAPGKRQLQHLQRLQQLQHLRNELKIPQKIKHKVITNANELRSAVLDNGIMLQDLDFDVSSFRSKDLKQERPTIPNIGTIATQTTAAGGTKTKTATTDSTTAQKEDNKNDNDDNSNHKNIDVDLPLNHEVIKLIEQRFKSNSKPGSRNPNDSAHLSLSIEGGGMRGAVSAGMASAIAVLGLSDCFDSIYGSSAGSVVGAYMISRQMCIDVYTQVLTAAKTKFVSKTRLASSLATNLLDQAVNNTIFSKNMNPAMNISYVLDSIMHPEHGLRPLDMNMFQINDQKQQLRIVTSCVRNGEMETHCLGSKNVDFFDIKDEDTGEILERATTMEDGKRHGLFACLETSMTVPAATGPPLPLIRHKDVQANMTSRCFDAFCYEPIPYRSAVEEGATHVLVLKTRPEGNPIGTKPGLFEKIFAPMYFDSNDMPQVSKYFENGGQQYIYVEDYLTLDEGKNAIGPDGVSVPPRKLLYGVEKDEEAMSFIENRDQWKKAHLLPISVPTGTPELSVLSVDTNEVLEAVQHGFAVAFDLLAPSTGIELNSHLNGKRVAELIFPINSTNKDNDILERSRSIAGDPIMSTTADAATTTTTTTHNRDETSDYSASKQTLNNMGTSDLESPLPSSSSSSSSIKNTKKLDDVHPCPKEDSVHLLERLPGFTNGKMNSLSQGLYYQLEEQ